MMKMSLPCAVCGLNEPLQKYDFELTDQLEYELTCENGHEVVFVLRNKSFELLFEMGIYALNDGYSREAVSNFAAAIERFHEFSIKVMAYEHGIKDYLNQPEKNSWRNLDIEFDNEYESAWKALSSQSERQYGAYIMLYLVTFKRSPDLLKNKEISFRNDITHKGKFPTKERALEYAKTTFNYIKTKLLELKSALPEAVDHVYSIEFRDISDEHFNGKTRAGYSMETTFKANYSVEKIANADLDEALKNSSSFRFFK